MTALSALETLMWTSFLIVFLFYACYFAVLYFFYKKKQSTLEHEKKPEVSYPTVSLIVPVYNEEKTIEKKIQNVEELDYPSDKMEVVFVDGRSTDKTAEIIKNYVRNCHKLVRVVEQDQREGYTRGIITGILNSAGEIIVLTDAAAYHSPDAIRHLVEHFNNRKVGAVTGRELVLGLDKGLGPRLEKSYRFFYDFMRKAETEMSSTPDSKGEILAVRREICNNIAAKLELFPNVLFDSCTPYIAKLMGYATVYDEQATYYEYAPSSFMDRMKHQVRRATYLIGALLLFKVMILRRKYGKFGLIILPAHFVMQCLLPWVFLLGLACLLIGTILDPMSTILLWATALGALIASEKSRVFLISFVQSQVALATAILKLATCKQSTFIETIPSTRNL